MRRKFSRRILAELDEAKYLGIRAGSRSDHRFIGLCMVVVKERVFAPSWTLERGGGLLAVRYEDPDYRAWFWVGAVGLAWAAASAIPLHDRRFRRLR